MNDKGQGPVGPSIDNEDIDTGPAVAQLHDFAVEPDPDLPGRVERSINRRILAADSIELSLNHFLRTAWSYLVALLEVLPLSTRDKPKE